MTRLTRSTQSDARLRILKLHTSIYPGRIKAISRWFERSEHHRRTMKVQIDPEAIAAYEAVIPIGMKVSG